MQFCLVSPGWLNTAFETVRAFLQDPPLLLARDRLSLNIYEQLATKQNVGCFLHTLNLDLRLSFGGIIELNSRKCFPFLDYLVKYTACVDDKKKKLILALLGEGWDRAAAGREYNNIMHGNNNSRPK